MQRISIAERVFGVASHGQEDGLYTALNTLHQTNLPPETIAAECARLDALPKDENGQPRDGWYQKASPSDREDYTELAIVRSICDGEKIKFSNVLQHWPFYQAAYAGARTETAGGERQALLAGCLTTVSAAGFVALCQEVYDAKPVITDLTTSRYRSLYGDFRQDDILNTSLSEQSFDIVQTNNLLRLLQTTEGQRFGVSGAIERFTQFAYPLLKPGGQLIMCEVSPKLRRADFPEYNTRHSHKTAAHFEREMAANLARVGFTDIAIEPLTEHQDPAFFFDAERNFAAYPKVTRKGLFQISAHRQASTVS